MSIPYPAKDLYAEYIKNTQNPTVKKKFKLLWAKDLKVCQQEDVWVKWAHKCYNIPTGEVSRKHTSNS